MAIPKQLLLCFLLISVISTAAAQLDQSTLLLSTAAAMSSLSLFDDSEFDNEDIDGVGRRSLFWRKVHYYISYGALSANRIPCPPRSGRSYYTHNCYRARGPVRPYYRGCSAITGCKR
ncbi:hypothetical protein GIB67_017602 [Kingdonia uniflora]|uniref:Uncharacterized protein n=1 Tax=Kingdonia uniflora TaxID=39325 RepID=A0A7J7LNC1_9MAGN|nr:hypothetical protein GIB67_017602 [Kingdonia uniflora]